MSYMVKVFARLALKRHFDEGDFMRECQEVFQVVGVLNGGTFRAMGNQPSTKMLTGSYSKNKDLSVVGYHPTRVSRIKSEDFKIRSIRL